MGLGGAVRGSQRARNITISSSRIRTFHSRCQFKFSLPRDRISSGSHPARFSAAGFCRSRVCQLWNRQFGTCRTILLKPLGRYIHPAENCLCMMSCESCFASCKSFRHADPLSRLVIRDFSKRGVFTLRWQDIWARHVLPFLVHEPDCVILQYPGDCGSFGRQAQVACMWRQLSLMPLLMDTCLDFWVVEEGRRRITRVQYHETIEIILMFIQGKANNVPRPLPAIAGLKKHGYL